MNVIMNIGGSGSTPLDFKVVIDENEPDTGPVLWFDTVPETAVQSTTSESEAN